MGPDAPPCAHQIRSMGEGANRKPTPNTNRPPPTKALAVCLNMPANIQDQPPRRIQDQLPGRKIHLRAAHRAKKGGARARRLSQSAKNTDVTNQEDYGVYGRRNRGESRRSESSNHRRDGRHGADLVRKGAGAGPRSVGLSAQPLCRCTSRLPSSRAGREHAGSGRGGGCSVGTGRRAIGLGTRSTTPTTPFSASTANRLGPGASAMTRRRRGGEARPRSPATLASNLFNGGKIDRRSTDGKQTP